MLWSTQEALSWYDFCIWELWCKDLFYKKVLCLKSSSSLFFNITELWINGLKVNTIMLLLDVYSNVIFWKLSQFFLQIKITSHTCFKIAIKTIPWVVFSTSLYFLESFHCVKASYIILVGSEFTEMKQLLQTYVYSLKMLNFMLTMSSAQGYTVSSWDHNIWAETWLNLQ